MESSKQSFSHSNNVCSQLVVYQSGVSADGSIPRSSRGDFTLDIKLSHKTGGVD